LGPDAVSPRLLKEASQILKSPLCRLFNLSLRTGQKKSLKMLDFSLLSHIKSPSTCKGE
jgi:hypothetical protein